MVARLRDDHLRDTRANQPDADTVDIGTLYFVSDENGAAEYSDGTAWWPVGAAAELVEGPGGDLFLFENFT